LHLVGSGWAFHEECNCVCYQGWCTRGIEGQRPWFLLSLLFVHITFALNADDAFFVVGQGWWDQIGCDNGISEYSRLVVINQHEM